MGYSKFKVRKHDKFRIDWSKLRDIIMQVQNGIRLGVRMSKRPHMHSLSVAHLTILSNKSEGQTSRVS